MTSADFDDVLAAETETPPRPVPAPAPASPRVSPPAPAPRPSSWRSDPAWVLASWDASYFTERPTDIPPEASELAQPDAWASLYDGSRAVATWSRVRR